MGNILMHLWRDNNVRRKTDFWSGLVFVCRRWTRDRGLGDLYRFGIGSEQRYTENGWNWDKDFTYLCEYAQHRHKLDRVIGWYTPDGKVYTYDHDCENIGKRLDVVRRSALADPHKEPYLTVVSGRDQSEAGLVVAPEAR